MEENFQVFRIPFSLTFKEKILVCFPQVSEVFETQESVLDLKLYCNILYL
jgi:hypothetical protein